MSKQAKNKFHFRPNYGIFVGTLNDNIVHQHYAVQLSICLNEVMKLTVDGVMDIKSSFYLNSNIPNTISTVVSWNDPSQPLEERVRSYLDINCAHCHSDEGHCNYRPMRFEYQLTGDPRNIGVCVEPDTQFIPNSYIVKPNDTDLSILYYRLSTTEVSLRMPLLGRTINHNEGIELIQEWITSLNNCD